MATLELTSSLDAPAEQVRRHASTFEGIHRELWPMHMSGGSRLTLLVRDRLEFEPRILPMWVSRLVRRVFERRHARLRARFGGGPP
jgi:hypothetical protein